MYANLTDEELANLLDVEPHNEEARDEAVRRFLKRFARLLKRHG